MDIESIKSIDPEGTYFIEVPIDFTSEQVESIKSTLSQCLPDTKFIILSKGVKIVGNQEVDLRTDEDLPYVRKEGYTAFISDVDGACFDNEEDLIKHCKEKGNKTVRAHQDDPDCRWFESKEEFSRYCKDKGL